jgi:hypothetical protein
MNNVINLIKKDFKRKWKNPVVIIGFLFIPVIFTIIFGIVFGSSGEPSLPQVPVLAIDKDQGFLSQFFLTALNQGELKKLVSLKAVEEK